MCRTKSTHFKPTVVDDKDKKAIIGQDSVDWKGVIAACYEVGGTESFTIVPRFVPPRASGPTGGFVAPMPGTVLEVRVAAGDTVSAGDTLIVLEAMKMEHHMNAPADGVVAEVRVEAGGSVATGDLLLIFESTESNSDEAQT